MTKDLVSWIGRTRVRSERLSLAPARGMTALLDRDPESLETGSPLPPGWHWLYFWSLARQSALADDGHEARGAFLPAVDLLQRMWAGGELEFLEPLHIGDTVTRSSTIADVAEKEGRSGPLVFVTVLHEIGRSDAVCTREFQRLVYLRREAGARRSTPSGSAAASREPAWEETFLPTAAALFRFSALTFNAHRIHYDHRYATEHEGYRGLVVHGPLLALLLLDAAQRHGVASPRLLRFRARSPLFEGELVTLSGQPGANADEVRAWASGPGGAVSMEATVA